LLPWLLLRGARFAATTLAAHESCALSLIPATLGNRNASVACAVSLTGKTEWEPRFPLRLDRPTTEVHHRNPRNDRFTSISTGRSPRSSMRKPSRPRCGRATADVFIARDSAGELSFVDIHRPDGAAV